jgi:hypothetical protein
MHPEDTPDTHDRPQAPDGLRAPAPGDIRPRPPWEARVDNVDGAQPQAEEGACAQERLHVCFHCACELAYPLDWSEEGPRHWRIVLRCPECESRREGVFEQGVVERLDDELDRAASALLADLRRMTHANMSEEVNFFIRALDADLIVPSDF